MAIVRVNITMAAFAAPMTVSPGRGGLRRVGCHVHDDAACAAAHARQDGAGHMHRRQAQLGECASHVGCRDIDEQFRPDVGRGRAHQDVDTGQDLFGLRRDGDCGVGIGGVTGDEVRGCTDFGDRLRGQPAAVGIAPDDHDPRYAGGGERPG
jgi:hypothetical protein